MIFKSIAAFVGGIVATISGFFGHTPTGPIPVASSATTTPVQNVITSPLPGGTVVENGYTVDWDTKPNQIYGSMNTHMVFVSPAGERVQVPDALWPQLDPASMSSASKGWQSWGEITSFDMPVDPANKGVIILSTSKPLDEQETRILNTIYSYNLKTTELEQLFSEISADNSSTTYPGTHDARIFRTVGIDGSKVIIMYDRPGNSPGPCWSMWYENKDTMGYLELADIQRGVQPYTVPASLAAEGKQKLDQCVQSFKENGGI